MTDATARAADDGRKTVRVGWYESTYCYHDQNGERRGIACEYQRRIAAHTGWTYEYVEDSWPNLLQMLIDGELDLLSDVSYKEERAIPVTKIGSSDYYFVVSKVKNAEVTFEPVACPSIGEALAAMQRGEIDELVERMNARNLEAVKTGGIVIACGMAKREGDAAVAPVFERADQRMYQNKSRLKAMKQA